jgi:enamine deaminase RidA (YjgF/YER057c/UK114 family)
MRLIDRDAPDAPKPAGGYAQSVEVIGATRWLYVSGQIPVAAEGQVPSTFADQARLAWRNIEAQLRAAGMGIPNLVKVTTYLASREDTLANRAIRQEVLGSHRAALTVVVTDLFDANWRIEIEAIAAA